MKKGVISMILPTEFSHFEILKTIKANAFMAAALVVALMISVAAAMPAHASTGPAQDMPPSKPIFEKRIVELENSQRVYTLIHQGAPEKATFVLLNGLVYEVGRWDTLAEALAKEGFTVIRYAFSGQPENLRLLAPGEDPGFFETGLELKGLARELKDILGSLGIYQKVHVVGLSYGASVAAEFSALYPELTEATVLMAPLVIPLDFYDPGGNTLRMWLNSVRFWENAPCDFYGSLAPWFCMARDQWYDAFYNLLYERYIFERISDAPEDIDETQYKKSIFHLVRATRDFDLRSYTPRLTNVHLFIATDDADRLKRDQERAWTEVPDTEKRSFVVFQGAHHGLPDAAPLRAAEVLKEIGLKNPQFQDGSRTEIHADR